MTHTIKCSEGSMDKEDRFKMSVKKRDINQNSNDANYVSKNPGKSYDLLWTKFENLPPLPGFLSNFIVVFHDERIMLQNDRGDKVGLSHEQLNYKKLIKEEKNLTMEIIKYLILNGVDVRVVCTEDSFTQTGVPTYDKNADIVDEPSTEKIVDVTIVVLFPNATRIGLVPLLYHQANMTKLVAESVKASRKGVIILGNIKQLDGIRAEEWQSFLTYVDKKQLSKNHLQLYCPRHKFTNDEIYNAFDMRQSTLLGGCKAFCESKTCGHACPFVCHSKDIEHRTEEYRCNMQCLRICDFGHRCKKACWEKCLCEEKVIIEYLCHHLSPVKVPCYKAWESGCTEMVKRLLECGHTIKLKCFQQLKSVNIKCPSIVRKVLPCNHELIFRCKNKDSLQLTCQVSIKKKFPCGHEDIISCDDYHNKGDVTNCSRICKRLLKCGHFCERECHSDDPQHESAACELPCEKMCARGVHSCGGTHPCKDPCKPCSQTYEYKLACTHWAKITCSEPDLNENNYRCMQPCVNHHMLCKHSCAKLCGEECGKCELVVRISPVECQMNHFILSKCHEAKTVKCTEKVLKLSTKCDHLVEIQCHEIYELSSEELSQRCNVICNKMLDANNQCGHICTGKCKDCNMGRFHSRCKTLCDKILICGHKCMTPCNMLCSPCPRPCFYSCEHRKCKLECGVPCNWDCDEPCPYSCEHSRCTKKCSEICDKKLCTEPCPKTLKCGHSCVGFCGEVCPPLCRHCNEQELMPGLLMVKFEITEEERFIYLEGCNHCIESEVMDTWMSVDDCDDEVLPKRCPICRTRIKWLCRYSDVLYKNRQLIGDIRVKIFGDANEIKCIIDDIRGKLQTYSKQEFRNRFFPEFYDFITFEINLPQLIGPDGGGDFKSMSVSKAKFMEWVLNEWITGCKTMEEFSCGLAESRYSRVKEYWWDLLDIVSTRIWPMHPNEMKDYAIERLRIMDAIKLYSRLYKVDANQTTELIYSTEGVKAFANCEDAVFLAKPYTQSVRNLFLSAFKELNGVLNCTLKITDEERLEIVSAFGERSGRWFKCSNGHVYVITECGGATQFGTCNVCGTLIGGQQHVLVDNNFLATEMDGAEDPLYPTVLNRRQDH